jgi:hypothetical protein
MSRAAHRLLEFEVKYQHCFQYSGLGVPFDLMLHFPLGPFHKILEELLMSVFLE